MQLFPHKTRDKVWKSWALFISFLVMTPAIFIAVMPIEMILDPSFYLRMLPLIFGGLIAGWLSIWHVIEKRKTWATFVMMFAVISVAVLCWRYLWSAFLMTSLMILIPGLFAFWPEHNRHNHSLEE